MNRNCLETLFNELITVRNSSTIIIKFSAPKKAILRILTHQLPFTSNNKLINTIDEQCYTCRKLY